MMPSHVASMSVNAAARPSLTPQNGCGGARENERTSRHWSRFGSPLESAGSAVLQPPIVTSLA